MYENYNKISQLISETDILINMSIEENDNSSMEDIQKSIKQLNEDIEKLELFTYFKDKYDSSKAILSITSGAGGTDAQDWAMMLLRMYQRWIEIKNWKSQLIDLSYGEEAGIKNATLIIEGEYAYGYLKSEIGIHRLVRLSPFNANNKRQTSFAAVDIIPEIESTQDIEIKDEDIRIDTYRASGAGGQHVNKTDSAVRITYLPKNIVVQCQSSRSQANNKETAIKVLKSKILEEKEKEEKKKIGELRGDQKDIAWGHQIRSYVFHPYNMVKDHRTNIETSNVTKVMDGEIDLFIEGYLKKKN